MVLVNIATGHNAETSVEQLHALCTKDGIALDIQPSRRGDYFIVKFNGHAVGKLYHNPSDAILLN